MAIVLAWFSVNPAVVALFILIVTDVVTGLLRAIAERRVASDVSAAGMTRKAGMLIVVALCVLLQGLLPGVPAASTAAIFYCLTEVISLVENLDALGVPLPSQLRRYFAQIDGEPAPPAKPNPLDAVASQFDSRSQ